MTTVIVGEKCVVTKYPMEPHGQALEKILIRMYGRHTWAKSNDMGKFDQEHFKGYCTILKSKYNTSHKYEGYSDIIDENVWIEVY